MKHTVTSVTAQARELAGARPFTESNYLVIAAEIYGHDGVDEEFEFAEITGQFSAGQFNAWLDEPIHEAEAELRRHCRRGKPPRGTSADWLSLAVTAVLLWQKNAALMPLARAFAARLKTEEENA